MNKKKSFRIKKIHKNLRKRKNSGKKLKKKLTKLTHTHGMREEKIFSLANKSLISICINYLFDDDDEHTKEKKNILRRKNSHLHFFVETKRTDL